MMNKEIKTFKELLELQEQLDTAIAEARKDNPNYRERTLDDITMSMIAEVIEFNEEMKDSHKTWKQKKFDIGKAKEEAVDVLFFILQYVNKQKELLSPTNYGYLERDMSQIFYHFKTDDEKADYLLLISYIITNFVTFAFETLIAFFGKLGMNREEVANIYIRKWEKNMGRINGDWSSGK